MLINGRSWETGKGIRHKLKITTSRNEALDLFPEILLCTCCLWIYFSAKYRIYYRNYDIIAHFATSDSDELICFTYEFVTFIYCLVQQDNTSKNVFQIRLAITFSFIEYYHHILSSLCRRTYISKHENYLLIIWWRHQKETFSTLLAICTGNSPVTGEFPAQRSVTRCFNVFLDLRLNKRLSKQLWGWWFETLSRPLWRHYNGCSVNC